MAVGIAVLYLYFAFLQRHISGIIWYLNHYIDLSNWNIGQIVGVTIWAQAVLEFV